jgi:hypothetical protein
MKQRGPGEKVRKKESGPGFRRALMRFSHVVLMTAA